MSYYKKIILLLATLATVVAFRITQYCNTVPFLKHKRRFFLTFFFNNYFILILYFNERLIAVVDLYNLLVRI